MLEPDGGAPWILFVAGFGTVALVPSLYWAGNFVRVQKILCAEVGANLTRAQWRQYVPNEPYRAICPVHP